MSKPSKTERTILLLGLENRDTNGLGIRRGPQRAANQTANAVEELYWKNSCNFEQIPIYNSFNPLTPEGETQPLVRSSGTLDPEGFGIGITNFALAGDIWVQGSGIRNIPPAWMKLLRACGFGERRYASHDSPTAGTPTGASDSSPYSDSSTVVPDIGTGTYYYEVTALLKANGTDIATTRSEALFESKLSGEESAGIAVTAGDAISLSSLTTSATGIRRLYRTKASGTAGAQKYFIAEIPSGTNSYTDRLHDDNLTEKAPTTHATLNEVQYYPLSDNQEAATIVSYLDSRKYPAKGAVGTLNFEGTAGNNVRGAFDIRGATDTNVKTANPDPLSSPGIPPQLCAADCKLLRYDGTVNTDEWTPVLIGFQLQLGTQVSRRFDANQPCDNAGMIEYAVVRKPDPRLILTVEEDEDRDWVTDFKAGNKYAFRLTVGQGEGHRIVFGNDLNFMTETTAVAPAEFKLQLAEPPGFDDSEGFRTRVLNWSCTGIANSWLYIIHR